MADPDFPKSLNPFLKRFYDALSTGGGGQGPAGPQGPEGPQGPQGDPGAAGSQGATGPEGPEGPAGADGQDGAAGAAGPPGDDGAQGIQGVQGDPGADGDDGAQGIQGIQGVPGADSTVPGPEGPEGQQGIQGIQGIQGVEGPEGPEGPPGSGGDPLDAWPVGSVFIGVVTTSPATLLGGGTWVRVAEGRMLVSQSADADFDTARETGGAKTVTLTAAQSGSPEHTHIETNNSATNGGLTGWGARDTSTNTQTATSYSTQANVAADAAEAHSIMNPYFVVYMWERTA